MGVGGEPSPHQGLNTLLQAGEMQPAVVEALARVGQARRGPVEALGRIFDTSLHCPCEPGFQLGQAVLQLDVAGTDQLGGGGGGRGAQVSGKIGDAHIGLVPHPDHDRYRACTNGSRLRLRR